MSADKPKTIKLVASLAELEKLISRLATLVPIVDQQGSAAWKGIGK